jgi:glycosyltransferase involved in cell wall biosynthesis
MTVNERPLFSVEADPPGQTGSTSTESTRSVNEFERNFAVVRRSGGDARSGQPVRPAPTVSIVIPAKNEAKNLPHVLAALPAGLHEVILVDGNSTDDTVEVARSCYPDIKVIGQTRKGKGNALACGFEATTGDFIVMIDADGSTDPAEIPRFVDALRQGADFAKGSRFMPGAGSNDISRLRSMGNFWLNKIVNVIYGTRYTDLCYGYNAFRRDCLLELELIAETPEGEEGQEMLWGDGFEVETLINVRIAKAGVRVFEVPSFERNRLHGTSNLNAFSDGLRVLRTIYIERKRGTRRAALASSTMPRHSGKSWAVLSTYEEESA